jgi:hypothetical protein
MCFQNTDAAVAVAKGDQIFAKQSKPDWSAVGPHKLI